MSESSDQFSSSGVDVVTALSTLGLEVGNDLHRTNAKPALRELQAVIPGSIDARIPEVLTELISQGFACSYDGRSIDQYDSFPTERSGKWLPQVTLIADLNHALVARLLDRLCFYRLAWRSTCGHPKTNEREHTSLSSPTRLCCRQLDTDRETTSFPTKRECISSLLGLQLICPGLPSQAHDTGEPE